MKFKADRFSSFEDIARTKIQIKLLTLYQTTKFMLGRVENIVGKRRTCSLPAFFSFLTMFFFKVFFSRSVKSLGYVVKGYRAKCY